MTVDTFYNLSLHATAKNKQQGYLSPGDFNLLAPQAETSFMDYLLGQFQQYQVGRPVPRVDYSMSEKARQRLTPFIGPPEAVTIDGTGLGAYPSDYQQADAMYTTTMDRIRYVQQHKLYSYLNSQIDPVLSNPIWLIQGNGFQFYPVTLGNALLSYVKKSPGIFWNSSPDPVTGLPIYLSAGSRDPLWYDVDCYEIISRLLRMMGINLEAPMIAQYANQIIQGGQ